MDRGGVQEPGRCACGVVSTCMFGGEHVESAVSRRLWKVEISSRETGVGSARRRTAANEAFAMACWCVAADAMWREVVKRKQRGCGEVLAKVLGEVEVDDGRCVGERCVHGPSPRVDVWAWQQQLDRSSEDAVDDQ